MDIHLSIPNVVGESKVTGYTGKIQLIAASYGFGRPNDPSTGMPTGKMIPGGILISKLIDSSTGFLGQAAANKTILSSSTFIAFSKPEADRPFEFIRWTLTNARIVAHHISGHAGSTTPTEVLTLAFSQIVVQNKRRDALGNVTTKSFLFKLS